MLHFVSFHCYWLYFVIITKNIIELNFLNFFIFFKLNLKVIQNEPDTPPSLSQLEIRTNNTNKTQSDLIFKQEIKSYKNSLINLMKNFNFLLIFISYGINVGVYYSISTLLNQIISFYYQVINIK